nr:hypothetical protein [Tanacetum cinerariifolium]
RLEVADYLKVLGSIAQAVSEHSGTISDAERRRIGLVYTQLAQRVPDLTATEKAAITVWSRTYSLLAASNNFEPAAELKWITQDGFQSVAGGFKALYIPANCQTDTP